MSDLDAKTAGRLVAVVVTYNRLEHLRQTVTRLLESPASLLASVVVVDNASSDGTAEWLQAETAGNARLHVIRQKTNSGGAGGFSTGLRAAASTFDPDWVVVMDDDGRPATDAIRKFHELDHSGWDAVASAVYLPGGEICDMNRPSRNPFWHLRVFLRTLILGGGRGGFHLKPADYKGSTARHVDITSFVGLFLSRRAIDMAGYPDPALFVYGDDGIYTLGLSQQGGRIAFQPEIHFEHACSTFSGEQRRFNQLWKVYYYHRNLMMLYRMAAGWMFWPLLLLILPKWVLKVADHSGVRRGYLRLLWVGILDGLRCRTDRPHTAVIALSQEQA